MYRFVYVEVEMPAHKAWYLLVDTIDSLYGFMDVRSSQLMGEYHNLKTRTKKHSHFKGEEQRAISLVLENTPNRRTIVDDTIVIHDKFLSMYETMFKNDGSFLAAKNLAVRPGKDYKILRTIMRKELVFPVYTEEDIKVSRWSIGKHWYAKIGATHVVNKLGVEKWPTYERAYEEAVEFLKGMSE